MAKFRKIELESGPHGAHISIGHTLEGVRTNGHERVVSLYDVNKRLKEYEQECRYEIANCEKALKLTITILSKMNIFKTCPKCKGKKGCWTMPKAGFTRGYWEDCIKCKGRGILRIHEE